MGAEIVMDGGMIRFVIPAQAGIHCRHRRGSFNHLREWIPAFAGMTGGVL